MIYWICIVFACLWSLAVFTLFARSLRSLYYLDSLESITPRRDLDYPRLSIVVPACNEGQHIYETGEALLEIDYPDFEIILVNDRSTDETAQLIEQLAAEDERIVAMHIEELPEGWLGKVHASHKAMELAQGEYVLFTDADVQFQPAAIRRALTYVIDNGIEHLAVLPQLLSSGPVKDAMVTAFEIAALSKIDIAKVGVRHSGQFIGVGGFNLIKKSAFRQTEGFEWIKMEVGDDFGLALLMHKWGFKGGVLHSREEVALSWYGSAKEMIQGLTKNMFPASCQFSYFRLFCQILVTLFIFVLGPLLFLRLEIFQLLWPLPCIILAIFAIFSYQMRKTMRVPLLSLPLFPIGGMFLLWAIINSAIQCGQNGGIIWRGTHYPLALLREGQRVKL